MFKSNKKAKKIKDDLVINCPKNTQEYYNRKR